MKGICDKKSICQKDDAATIEAYLAEIDNGDADDESCDEQTCCDEGDGCCE